MHELQQQATIISAGLEHQSKILKLILKQTRFKLITQISPLLPTRNEKHFETQTKPFTVFLVYDFHHKSNENCVHEILMLANGCFLAQLDAKIFKGSERPPTARAKKDLSILDPKIQDVYLEFGPKYHLNIQMKI